MTGRVVVEALLILSAALGLMLLFILYQNPTFEIYLSNWGWC